MRSSGGRRVGTVAGLVGLTLLTGCDFSGSDYQDVLGRTDQRLTGALATVRLAPEPDELGRAVRAAADAAGWAGDELTRATSVPDEAAAGNAALAGRLRGLSGDITALAERVDGRAVCTGPAALAAIGAAPNMPGLRDGAARLAPPYRWGAALPSAEPPPAPPRLANGQLLTDRRTPEQRGDGVLEVRNEGTVDAVVKLVDRGNLLVSVAVTAGGGARVEGIADGAYDLFYTAGADWDPAVGAFAHDCEFHRFTELSRFQTRPVPGGTAYTVESITIRDNPDTPESITPVPPALLPG